ncbi:MAG: ABC transporter ATP-binding protein [bacterium]
MLRIQQLSKSYGKKLALDSVSFEIQPGEIFGLLGPNGAGKSTTVNLAVGLLIPDAGTVEINRSGSPLEARIRTQIGVSPQALAIYEELTGEENLAFFGKLQGLHGSVLRDRVQWALEFVELVERGRDYVRAYSGGMRRRLNLAIALVHNPPLLLLDEPTVGVDPQSRNAIFDNILELRREGKAILYTTHYMEEAQRLCNRVGILDQGKMLALDTVDHLIEQHGGKRILIADTDKGERSIVTENPVADLEKLSRGCKVLEFRLERPSLETVFLNLTGRKLRD